MKKTAYTNTCAGCKNNISKNEYLACSTCRGKFDLICAGISADSFRQFGEEHKKRWSCPECTGKLPRGDNTDTPVRSRNDYLQTNVSNENVTLRNKHSITSAVDKSLTESKLREIIKEELSSTLDRAINKHVTDQLKDIKEEIMSFRDSLTFFNKQYEDMKSRLDEKESIISNLQEDNNTLNQQVHELSNRLVQVEQTMRENNVEINGIPEHRTENLLTTVAQLAKTVNSSIADSDILQATRVAKLTKDTNKPRSVIVKLRSTGPRDALIAAVSQYNRQNPKDKLNSHHLGISGTKVPVYLQEHLAPFNKNIHAAARKRAREAGYKFVWIRNGRILVRKDEGSQAIQIRNSDSLKLII